MVVKLSIGDQIIESNFRLRIITDYESHINALDKGYEAEDAIFNGCIYEIITPQFNLVNRSQYRNGCDFKHEMIEYRCNICFIPTKVYCFVLCNIYLTGEDYKQQYLDFSRNEKRQSNNMTIARSQPFSPANNSIIGYFDRVRLFTRIVTERNTALYLYENHFCITWKNGKSKF